MPKSKAQQRATNKYRQKAYDLVQLTMPKGHKAEIQAHAAARGLSVNAYANGAIDERMARDDAATAPP